MPATPTSTAGHARPVSHDTKSVANTMPTMHNPGCKPGAAIPRSRTGNLSGSDAKAAKRTWHGDKANIRLQDLAQAPYSRHTRTVTIWSRQREARIRAQDRPSIHRESRMAPPVDRVQSDPAMPTATRVVVIGGGIIGICTAFFLARKGIQVVVCEKGEIAGEQSSRNWGWCRKMGRDPREVPLATEALRLWAEMNTLVGGETGFRRAGIVYLCRTKKDLAKREAWLEQVGRPAGLDSRLLTRDQMNRALPGLAGSWLGALSTPSDGRAEPAHAASAIAEGARRLGATILTQCAVR